MILTEYDIRLAMRNTRSNMAAARFLNVNYLTYKKYAKQYYDEEKQMSLFDIHINRPGKGVNKPQTGKLSSAYIPIEQVLSNNKPNYPWYLFKRKLIREGYILEECEVCGFHERRITDKKSPLVLVPKDMNFTNYSLDNLQVLCYNCCFLTYKDMYVSFQGRRGHGKKRNKENTTSNMEG